MNSSERFLDLPPPERVARYRELAEEMRAAASSALMKDTRLAYLRIAVEWLDMAESLEVEYGKVSVAVESELASLLREDPR